MREVAVAIIGAGLGGLGTALRLKQSGEPSFAIFERASRLGGTWRDNIYPGCCCDAPALLYWYSLGCVPAAEQPDWTHVYPRQREILAHLEELAIRRGIVEHCVFDTEVTAARWSGASWELATSTGPCRARFLVCATGQLSRPVVPKIPGQADFAGAQFHSARWDRGAAYAGKRVALVGNGASGVQIAPAIAPDVARLSVFQRTPNHILPRMDRAYSVEERALLREPEIRSRARRTCHEFMESTFRAFTRTGPQYDAIAMIESARRHLESQVADPALRAKLWPDYAFGCKRPLYSDDFYPVFQRTNVELVDIRIDRIDATGIHTVDGRHHPADLIVYATGFETSSVIGPLEIVGSEQPLRRTWREFPASYGGVMVSGYPNLFIVYGPNTNLGHNSVLGMHEAQIELFLACKRAVESAGARAIDVTPAAMDAWTRETRALLGDLAWSAGCTSWYQDAAGQIVTQWADTVDAYAARLSAPPPAHLVRG